MAKTSAARTPKNGATFGLRGLAPKAVPDLIQWISEMKPQAEMLRLYNAKYPNTSLSTITKFVKRYNNMYAEVRRSEFAKSAAESAKRNASFTNATIVSLYEVKTDALLQKDYPRYFKACDALRRWLSTEQELAMDHSFGDPDAGFDDVELKKLMNSFTQKKYSQDELMEKVKEASIISISEKNIKVNGEE